MSGKPCILLVFGFVVWIFCVAVEAAPFFYPENVDPSAPASNFDINNLLPYLEFFGYYDPKTESVDSGGSQTKAVEDLQRFAGLNVTGILDKETITLLRTQRCGKDDTDALRQMKEQGKRRRKRYYLQGSTWGKKDLTYRFKSFTPDLEEGRIREIMKTSLGMWSAASTLSIREEPDPTVSDDDVDILIRFVSGYHFDPYPFDGPGGTLAHAYYPLNNKGLSGDAHFDDDERFTTGTSDGINLDWVAVHEFGHSLGLGHSNVRDSIMYPWYKGYFPNIALTDDDILGLQALYGKPEPTTAGPTTNEPTTVPGSPTPVEPTTTLAPTPSTAAKASPPTPSTEAPGADICSARWDAAFERSDGRVYVFSNDFFWVLSPSLKVELGPSNISSRWKEIPRPIDEAYARTDGKIVFFSGKQYWIYNQDDTRERGPKPISDFGLPDYVDHIDAAFVYGGNKKTYFFWVDRYWRYDQEKTAIDPGYPRTINVWGAELASKPGTVMTWPRNGATYFFYGSYYYKILAGSKLSVAPNYPKKSGVAWANCKA